MSLAKSFLPECGLMQSFEGCMVHPDVVASLKALQKASAQRGFYLKPVSGYRSLERQLTIWNAKAEGKRPVLDDFGQVVNPHQVSEEDLMFAILRFSALPGGSRHHWGSDVDVIDANALPPNYEVQLVKQETNEQGIFAEMHRWLDQFLVEGNSGFFRPYLPQRDTMQCIADEPWHLSYAPLAKTFQTRLDYKALEQVIQSLDIRLKTCILDNLTLIYERYVWVPWSTYP